MSEFSPQAAPVSPPAYTPPPNVDQHWLKRPIIWGQSIPWLTLYALIFIAAVVFLCRPDSAASSNGRAFGSQDLQPTAQSAPLSFDTMSSVQASPGNPMAQAASASSMAQMQDQVAGMVASVRAYGEANREAITQVAASLKVTIENQHRLQQQIDELQAKFALSSAPAAVAQAKPVVRTAARQPARAAALPEPLSGMHLSAVQNGMAWVQWQDKTWAVEVGDTLGPVTVTGIDAPSRLVHTSAGTLQ
jgi:intracellular multiplication protein IcmG